MKADNIAGCILLLASFLLYGCSGDNGMVSVLPEIPPGPPGTNHPPVIDARPDTFAIVGDTLRIEISATDQDGDELQFHQETACTWNEIATGQCHPPIAYIDPRTGSYWFYPRTYDIPERSIMVTVTDGHGGYAYMQFDVTVSAGNQ